MSEITITLKLFDLGDKTGFTIEASDLDDTGTLMAFTLGISATAERFGIPADVYMSMITACSRDVAKVNRTYFDLSNLQNAAASRDKTEGA